jgi:hypothetical protein
MNGYYITSSEPNIKVPLEPQDDINLSFMNLIELVLPQCKRVYCSYNLLTELIIPEGCEYVSCRDNMLTKLILANSCNDVWCYNNYLTKLIIPKNCQVWCHNNDFHPIITELFESRDSIKIQLASNLQRNL